METKEKTNLGVKEYKILGGKVSMGELSPELVAEAAAFKEYKKDLEEAGECNPGNPDGAKKSRSAMVKYFEVLDKIPKLYSPRSKKLKALLNSLGLDY